MSLSRLPLPVLETLFVLAWSSGFIGARLTLNVVPIYLVMFWRFTLLSVALSPLVLRAWRQGALTRRGLGLHLMNGCLAVFAALTASIQAVLLGVPVGLAALAAALQPLMTAVLAGPVLKERVRPRQWAGLGVGLAGVGLAVQDTLGPAGAWTGALLLLSTLSLVAASLWSKAAADDTPVAAALGLQSAAAAVLFGLLAGLGGSLAPIASAAFAGSVAWFIVLPTFGGFGLYWLLLRRSTATRTASLIYFTPAVTMLWAWLMFGDAITWRGLAGLAVCLAGVWLGGAAGARAG